MKYFWNGSQHSMYGNVSTLFHLAETGTERYERARMNLIEAIGEDAKALRHHREIYENDRKFFECPSIEKLINKHLAYSIFFYLEKKKSFTLSDSDKQTIGESEMREILVSKIKAKSFSVDFIYIVNLLLEISIKADNDSLEKFYKNEELIEKNFSISNIRIWYRHSARILQKAGHLPEAKKRYKEALDIKDNDTKAIGDLYHLRE
ncbi:MAG: hypothetical protein ABEH43_08080, partial [Flavobacteriales bacterium]